MTQEKAGLIILSGCAAILAFASYMAYNEPDHCLDKAVVKEFSREGDCVTYVVTKRGCTGPIYVSKCGKHVTTESSHIEGVPVGHEVKDTTETVD